MGINPKRVSYGRPDRRALITEHAVGDGLGCTLQKAAWENAAAVEDGVVPALYPVSVDENGIATPFAGTTAAPAPLSGFTINPVSVKDGDDSTGYVWHGTIDLSLLPVSLDPAAISGTNHFVFGKA